ncbi:hypothetical protein D3C71_874760 [compost metagenome]
MRFGTLALDLLFLFRLFLFHLLFDRWRRRPYDGQGNLDIFEFRHHLFLNGIDRLHRLGNFLRFDDLLDRRFRWLHGLWRRRFRHRLRWRRLFGGCFLHRFAAVALYLFGVFDILRLRRFFGVDGFRYRRHFDHDRGRRRPASIQLLRLMHQIIGKPGMNAQHEHRRGGPQRHFPETGMPGLRIAVFTHGAVPCPAGAAGWPAAAGCDAAAAFSSPTRAIFR